MTLELIIALVVYVVTVIIVYGTFCDRLKELETEYRLNYARVCTTFAKSLEEIRQILETADDADETGEADE